MSDTPTSYCEQLLNFGIEPVNVLTNIAFLLFALLSFYKLRNSRGLIKVMLPLSLLAIGLGSTWWHMSHSSLGDIADTVSIGIFATIVTLIFLGKLFDSKVKISFIFFLFASLTLFAEQLSYLNGSVPYLVLLIGFVAMGIFYIKKFPTSKKIFIYSVLTFAIALFFRTIDMEVCNNFSIGSHFIWHMLVALFGYQLILLLSVKQY